MFFSDSIVFIRLISIVSLAALVLLWTIVIAAYVCDRYRRRFDSLRRAEYERRMKFEEEFDLTDL